MSIVAKIKVDYDDCMSVHNLVEELNTQLNKYNLSLEIENEEHDGYDIVLLKEIK